MSSSHLSENWVSGGRGEESHYIAHVLHAPMQLFSDAELHVRRCSNPDGLRGQRYMLTPSRLLDPTRSRPYGAAGENKLSSLMWPVS